MGRTSNLEYAKNDAENLLDSLRNSLKTLTYDALFNRIWECKTIFKLNKLIEKYHLKEIPNSYQNLTLSKLQNYRPRQRRSPVERTYYISGYANCTDTYGAYNAQLKRTKEYKYDKKISVGQSVQAFSLEEAKQKFTKLVKDAETILRRRDSDSPNYYYRDVDSVSIDNITQQENGVFIDKNNQEYQPRNELTTYMRRSKPVIYEFIPNDEKFNKNENFCVSDTFLGIYSPLIKSLTLDKFISLCYEVRGEKQDEIKQINLLDVGIIDDEEKPEKWKLEDGVSPHMLNEICKKLNISHYAFDITKQCFIKYISTSCNYPALVYYCVNNHMYWISDKKAAISLIRRSVSIEKKIKSICIEDDDTKTNIYKERDLHENIGIENLLNYKRSTIIYTKTNLNDELYEIIARYNYIPEIKNNKYTITQIKFNFEQSDVILAIDPNDCKVITYKRIQQLCTKHKIEFKNQTFGNLVRELREKFFNEKSIRHNFTVEERKNIYVSEGKICKKCKKELTEKNYQIDHIIPLACGGDNELSNLQILCKHCHFEKTKCEHENGYVKISETESSFNSTTKHIFNSSLNSKYAFVEKLVENIPKKYINHHIYHIDTCKCRKNELYYNKYDYPLFTVMDSPQKYIIGQTKGPGLY